MWDKSHRNLIWDGARFSGRAHVPNARKKANLVISQKPVKIETWFLA